MKILIVTPYLYPDLGGLENYVFEFANHLAKRGHKITIISSYKIRMRDIEVHKNITIKRYKYDFKVSNTPVLFKLYRVLSKELKRNKFDIINAHTPVPFFADISAIFAKIKKVPIVITYHCGSLYKRSIYDLLALIYEHTLEKLTLSYANKIIVLNEFVKNRFRKYSKTELVNMAFDIPLNDFYKTQKKKINNQIIFVGNLDKSHKWKGLDYLLKSMSIVKKRIPKIRLLVLGDGNFKNHYKRLSRQYGIEKNVEFLGKKTPDKLAEYYSSSKLLVLPSVSNAESFGRVIIEAAFYGTPSIGTKVGGVPYVIDDNETGILVKPRKSYELSQRIINLLQNKKLYNTLAFNSYNNAKKYDWNKEILKIEKIFLKAVTK